MRLSLFASFVALSIPFLFLASPARAEVSVTTDFVLRLPNAVVDKLAPQAAPSKGEEKFPLEDGGFEVAGAKVALTGAEAGVRYELAKPVGAGEHAWKVRTTKLSAFVKVGVFTIRKNEVKERDGVVIDQDALVECRNLTLRLKEEAGASVEGLVRASLEGGSMKLTLHDYKGHWPSGAWAVESLDCPGVAGIGGAVATQLMEILAQTSLLDSKVRPALEKALLAAGEAAGRGLAGGISLPTGLEGVSLNVQEGAVRELPGGFEMRGRLNLDFLKAKGELSRDLKLGAVSAAPVGASPQLLLPKEALDALLEAGFLAGLLKHELQSKDLEGFRALTQSRFKQFFAWPDLQRFPKDTNFLFRLQPREAPKLENASSSRAGEITGQVNLPLAIKMFAPIERRWFPYVEFRTQLNAAASFHVSGGALKVRLRAANEELSHAFSREYVDRFRPNTRISTRRIRDSLVESLNKEELSVPLPALKAGGLELKPNALGLLQAGREQALQLQFSAR